MGPALRLRSAVLDRPLVLLGCLLFGCGAAGSSLRPRAAATVTLAVHRALYDVWRPLGLGERLRPRDRLRLTVEVDRPAHVYVAAVSRHGPVLRLHPSDPAAAPLLRPAAPLRLPGPGESYMVDDRPGEEQVVVVASLRPLPDAAAGYLTADGPTPGERLRCRGSRCGGGDLRARTDATGVAVLRFPILTR